MCIASPIGLNASFAVRSMCNLLEAIYVINSVLMFGHVAHHIDTFIKALR
jgi:hypothetical protein